MKLKKFLLLFCTALMASAPLTAPRAEAATPSNSGGITSFSPTGEVADNVSMRMVFERPMVSNSSTGKALDSDQFPFTVTPSIEAEGSWSDNRTFSVKLLSPLTSATEYKVKPRADLKDLKDKKVSGKNYQFHTAGLSLEKAEASISMNNDAVKLRLGFNVPVVPAVLNGFISITVYDTSQKYFHRIDTNVPSKTIDVTLYTNDGSINLLSSGKPLKIDVSIAKGLSPQKGTLTLVKDELRSLEIKPQLMLSELSVAGDDDSPRINVNSNFYIKPETAKDFISVTPAVEFTVESNYYNGLRFAGAFKPRERYVFTFKKGLPANINNGTTELTLTNDYTQAIIMPDLVPSINLVTSNYGGLLSSNGDARVPVELVNVDKVDVSIWKLYENNIVMAALNGTYEFPRELSKRIYNKRIELTLERNVKARRAVSLSDMLSEDKGVFLLTITNPDYQQWYEQSQIVNLSDLGIVVRMWDDGLLAWVNKLSDVKPVEDATVRIYSRANQLLAEGKTDKDGVWLCQRTEAWSSEPSLTPALATVSSGGGLSYTNLTSGLLSQESFERSGRPWLTDRYDANVFSARDIYRTSEMAPFKGVVRNYDLTAPQPFPVLFVTRDPLGRTVKRATSMLSDEGSALYNFNIPSNALTGEWRTSLYIPGDEETPLAVMPFNVEDFAPPRIEVKLTSPAKSLTVEEETPELKLNAKYLFGAKAAGLKWEGSWRAVETAFVPTQDKWKGYSFGDGEHPFKAQTDDFEGGSLDEEGNATITMPETGEWESFSVINLMMTAKVMEEGGRWVGSSLTIPYYSSPYLLGIAADEKKSEYGYFETQKDIRFRAAALTPTGEATDPGTLTATLYKITWNYNMVQLDGHWRWQSSRSFSKVDSRTLTVTDGVGEFTFMPKSYGSYMVRVTDDKEQAAVSYEFYASSNGTDEMGGSQLLDRVEIETDKERYSAGDTAKVTLRAPFKGQILFTVETSKLLDRRVITADQAETVVEVPITEEMLPNAWCAAWLLRPVVEEANWSTHRAIGVKRLDLDIAPHGLNVKLTAPEKTEPAQKLPVSVTLTKTDGSPAKGEIAIALVDDGVLGITGYKTPDLLNYFLAPREMESNGYDVYDWLLPIEMKDTMLLHPAGGAAMAAFAGADKVQRFKILSLFEGAVSTDAEGVSKIELELPEFSGRGRLFAVATAGSSFGKAEQNIQIAREIVTEADLPRFAAPGDTFSSPVTIFNSAASPREVTISLRTEGGLAVKEGNSTFSVPAGGSHKWVVNFNASKPGSAKYVIETTWKDDSGSSKSFEQTIEIPIRSPYPTMTLCGSGVFESGKSDLKIPLSDFNLDGSDGGTLTLTDTPMVDITKATAFLWNYPHGCLEQTTSATWPFLVIADALADIDPLLVNREDVDRKMSYGLARIQSMQLYDGSFTMWPGGNSPYEWGSVYATHFLTEARKAGADFPEEVLKAALKWLKQYLASITPTHDKYAEFNDLSTKAYAAYVLALNGEKPLGWMHYLKGYEKNMWPSGRVFLAGAFSITDGKADALRELTAFAGTEALPPEAASLTLESNVRNMALLLSMWSEIEPKSAEAAELAAAILKAGQQNQWYSTQENATVAMALGRYRLKAGEDKSNLEGALTDSDGKEIITFKSGVKSSIEMQDLPHEALKLNVSGSGRGYYSWTTRGTPTVAPKADRKGLDITVSWTDRAGNAIDPTLPIAQGTEIVGNVTIVPSVYLSNLVFSYLLPAGMELENPRLKETPDAADDPNVHCDVRDDRLLLFINRLGTDYVFKPYKFVMRAVTKGSFVMPPVSAEGMYMPDVHFVGKQGKNVVIK